MYDTLLALGVIVASFSTALAVLVGFALLRRHADRRLPGELRNTDRVAFLFDGVTMVDATARAREILTDLDPTGADGTQDTGAPPAPAEDRELMPANSGNDWARLVAFLGARFATLADLPEQVLENGQVELVSTDGGSRLLAELRDGLLRLELVESEAQSDQPRIDQHTLAAMRAELATHRAAAEKAPFPAWRENSKGEITWANRAYLDLAEIVQEETDVAPWPPVRLFSPNGRQGGDNAPERVSLPLPDEGVEKWFELHRAEVDGETLFNALPADELVRAETNLSEFIATLTGTFAHLPIGLAVFDQERKLSMFNPALTDLTMLPAEFLCGQPTLFAFLDRLRDRRMMPEPRDYKGWRQEMSRLEEQAADGTYSATWFLPTGQTYRVTGQPHPGGAMALLFEDISSEMSLTHRFKAELEMGQAVLDGLDDAVAVFSAGGILTMTNAAFVRLWDTDPATSMTEISVTDATSVWGRKCHPTPVWRQLATFTTEPGERTEWEAPVTLRDGRVLNCRFRPLVQGATMVTFAVAHGARMVPEAEPAPALAAPQ